jgi:hypothetical protein
MPITISSIAIAFDEETKQHLERIRKNAPSYLNEDAKQLFALISALCSGRNMEELLSLLMPIVADIVMQGVERMGGDKDANFLHQLNRIIAYMTQVHANDDSDGGDKGTLQ